MNNAILEGYGVREKPKEVVAPKPELSNLQYAAIVDFLRHEFQKPPNLTFDDRQIRDQVHLNKIIEDVLIALRPTPPNKAESIDG